jgi:hypothetical protein
MGTMDALPEYLTFELLDRGVETIIMQITNVTLPPYQEKHVTPDKAEQYLDSVCHNLGLRKLSG